MASEPNPGRFGKPPPRLLYQLGLLARVNVYAVPPTTLLIFILSSDHSTRNLARLLVVSTVVANCNFLFLNSFYHLVWQRWRARGTQAYVTLAAVAPFLGAGAALIAKGLLWLFAPGLTSASLWPLMGMNALLATLFGLAFFRVEDLRQSQHVTQARLETSEGKQKDLEGANERAQIVSLHALIKPHFVFNTLNAIVALIHEEPQKAEETTLRLARLMHYLLEVSDGDMMSLKSEMGVVEAYLEIEKVRLGNRLRYDIQFPPELSAIPVPGLLVQPLVENAVMHGVRQRPDGGYVRVKVSRDEEYCQVEVIDNGPGFSTHHGAGQATRLMRSRLEWLYRDDYEFRLERDDASGETVVVLRFPLAIRRPAHELLSPPLPESPLRRSA